MLQTVKCIVQTHGEAVVRDSWNVIAGRNDRLICHSYYAHMYGADCHETQSTSHGFVFGICGVSSHTCLQFLNASDILVKVRVVLEMGSIRTV